MAKTKKQDDKEINKRILRVLLRLERKLGEMDDINTLRETRREMGYSR